MGYLNSDSWKKLIEIVADSLSDSIRFAETYKVDKMLILASLILFFPFCFIIGSPD